MTDENADRIRDLELRIAQWGSEHAQTVRNLRETNSSLKATLMQASRLTMFGSIPSVVWIVAWVVIWNSRMGTGEPILNQFVFTCELLLIFGLISAGAARASGLSAHWWFRHSLVHERLACSVITLLANVVLFGWVVVLFRW